MASRKTDFLCTLVLHLVLPSNKCHTKKSKNILISYSSKYGAPKLDCKEYEQRVIMHWPNTLLYKQQSVTASIERHMKFFYLVSWVPQVRLLQNRCRINRCYDNKCNFIWWLSIIQLSQCHGIILTFWQTAHLPLP